jgi:hypothetical protein
LVFLYNSRSQLSVQLLSRLKAVTPDEGITVWSDRETSDPGFDLQLTDNLRRADAIIFAISSEGLGRYQRVNEIGRVVDALRMNYSRRLVLAFVGGVEAPSILEVFKPYESRTDRITLAADDASLEGLLKACVPEYGRVKEYDDASRENELALKLMPRIERKRDLVIVIGPYAFAETEYGQATPAKAIERFVADNGLTGAPPWIDVMGSVARSLANADDEAIDMIRNALQGKESFDQSGLGVYLRLIAANWIQKPWLGRLLLVTTMPDEWIDLALGSTALPIEHVKLINNANGDDRLVVHKLTKGHSGLEEHRLAADDPELENTRVILVKPFGSIANEKAAQRAMLSSRDWREGMREMNLPIWATEGMAEASLLVLGAGVFSPNLDLLFNVLMKSTLEQKAGNKYRYLIHNPNVETDDPLHRIEADLIRRQHDDSTLYDEWTMANYKLKALTMDPLKLLVWIEHYLKDLA